MIKLNENNLILDALKKWIGSIILLPIVIYLIQHDGRFFIVDYINLLIHEGGHGIFKIFGKYVYTLGGTIAQILIPGMFVVFYLAKRKRAPAQFSLIWLGQNLINISIYASDAQAQKLPLLGGKKVYHDWNYLLREINLLNYDYAVGLLFYSLAIAVFIISLLLPLFLSSHKISNINLEL